MSPRSIVHVSLLVARVSDGRSDRPERPGLAKASGARGGLGIVVAGNEEVDASGECRHERQGVDARDGAQDRVIAIATTESDCSDDAARLRTLWEEGIVTAGQLARCWGCSRQRALYVVKRGAYPAHVAALHDWIKRLLSDRRAA